MFDTFQYISIPKWPSHRLIIIDLPNGAKTAGYWAGHPVQIQKLGPDFYENFVRDGLWGGATCCPWTESHPMKKRVMWVKQ